MFQGFSKPLDIANKTSCTRVVTKAAIALPSISLVSIFPCSENCAIQQELAFQSKILVPCCSLSNSSCSIDVLPCFIWESGNHRFSPIPRLKSAAHCTPCSFAHGLHCHDPRLSSSVLRFAMRSQLDILLVLEMCKVYVHCIYIW